MPDMRNTKGITEIRESRDIDLRDMRLDAIDGYLDRMAAGLTDARIVIETEYNYGDPEVIVQTIEGWRPATDVEIRFHAQEKETSAAAARRRAELDLERIRREHPDLLT